MMIITILALVVILGLIVVDRLITEQGKKEGVEINRNFRIILRAVMIGIFLLLTLSKSVFFLNESQNRAVVVTLGKPTVVEGAGIKFKIPWISKVERINTTIQGFAIGYTKEKDENGNEVAEFNPAESLMITSDFNFVNVDFYVEYRITDPIDYIYGSNNPEEILKNVAQASIRNTIGQHGVDEVLTTGKVQIEGEIQDLIITEMEEKHTGLTLIKISIQDSEPPTVEVQKAFKEVETAKQAADEKKNNAEKYYNEKMPAAEATADKIKKNAQATKNERVNEAKGEVALFKAMYEEYQKNPESTKLRLYYENMEELLPNLNVIINGTEDSISNIFINGKGANLYESAQQEAK